MVMKLDMSKAYDRLEWSFISDMMRALGFSDHWIKLIMFCISTVSYKIKLNGDVGNCFTASCGLRQGDPISPYLFILAAEGLSTLIHSAVNNGTLTGLQLARSCPSLSHLMFADDSMILTKASVDEVYTLQNILNTYSLASGQRINVSKSELLFSRDVNSLVQDDIANILGMPIADTPSKYLGLPGNWHGSKT